MLHEDSSTPTDPGGPSVDAGGVSFTAQESALPAVATSADGTAPVDPAILLQNRGPVDLSAYLGDAAAYQQPAMHWHAYPQNLYKSVYSQEVPHAQYPSAPSCSVSSVLTTPVMSTVVAPSSVSSDSNGVSSAVVQSWTPVTTSVVTAAAQSAPSTVLASCQSTQGSRVAASTSASVGSTASG